MLQVDDIEVVYGGAVLVLRGLSFSVPEGRIVALLGANGAGKSTTLKSVSGLLRAERGQVTRGTIRFDGKDVGGCTPDELVGRGIFHVMEGRRVFEELTVEENLACGGYKRTDRGGMKADLDMVYDFFPRLRERRRQQAGYLSGGEQQMLAIGRGLMAAPRLMLLDEPSLGIAPLLVQEIFGLIARINRERGTTILLVEQNASIALKVAHHAFLMEGGRVVLDGPAESLRSNDEVRQFYLGFSDHGEKKDYRAMKHAIRQAHGGSRDEVPDGVA
jgi:branched-chain amino acid transport system ATP-binding protein